MTEVSGLQRVEVVLATDVPGEGNRGGCDRLGGWDGLDDRDYRDNFDIVFPDLL